MKNPIITWVTVCVLSGCADQNIAESEKYLAPPAPEDGLVGVAKYAESLSKAYMEAANKTVRTQDIQSALILTSAVSFVHGGVIGAPQKVLSNRALTGSSLWQAGKRVSPNTAIEGMYIGAKRLNCIATYASTFAMVTENNAVAARLALGAIEEVKITTRESIVREVADFNSIVEALSKEVQERKSVQTLEGFATGLSMCLNKGLDLR